MLPYQPKSIPLDDLIVGREYHFSYKNGSYVRGPFDGFRVQRGQPLVVRVPKGREVYLIPVWILADIFLI